jgi:hypothetical protein
MNKKKRDYQHKRGYKNQRTIPFDVWAHTYGWDKLYLEILEENLTGEQARIQERYWYLQLRPLMNKQMPYNTQEDRELYWNRRLIQQIEQECLASMKV